MIIDFAKLLHGLLLLGALSLVGCQTGPNVNSNAYVQPNLNAKQITVPTLAPKQDGAKRLAATPPPVTASGQAVPGSESDVSTALVAQEQQEAAQVATVALPLSVPVPKRRSGTPFRVSGESTTQAAVAIASLDPSSGIAAPTARSKRRVRTANGKKLVGPVRTSQRRVAALRKRHGAKYSKRRARLEPLIRKHAKAAGVPVRLAMAVVHVESSFRTKAKGAAGEIGLMQLMPGTARYMGYRGSMRKLYNPNMNLRYGMKYLAKAHRLGKGNLCNVILKYNAGHGAKKMNPISRKYCKRIRRLMKQGV